MFLNILGNRKMDDEIDLFNAIYLRIKFEQSLGLESLPRDKELVADIKKAINDKRLKQGSKTTSANAKNAPSLEDVEKALEKVQNKHVAKSSKKKPLIEFADIKLDDNLSEKDYSKMELSADEKHEAIKKLHTKY